MSKIIIKALLQDTDFSRLSPNYAVLTSLRLADSYQTLRPYLLKYKDVTYCIIVLNGVALDTIADRIERYPQGRGLLVFIASPYGWRQLWPEPLLGRKTAA